MSLSDKVKKILDSLDEYIVGEKIKRKITKVEAVVAIMKAVERVVPQATWTGKSEGGSFYRDWTTPEDDGWNACREEMLRRLKC